MAKWGTIVFSVFSFTFFFVIGAKIAFKSWDGATYVNAKVWYDGKRDPAAIGKIFDFSHLNGSVFRNGSKKQMFYGAQIQEQSDRMGVSLGHFLVKTVKGKKLFACRQFNRIEMTFEASGFASNGQKPVMVVDGQCDVTANINRIEPLWIPVKDIVRAPASNGDFSFRGKKPVNVKFDQIDGDWPHQWVLSQVRFYSVDPKIRDMIVGRQEILSQKKHRRLSLNWDKWVQ